MAAACIFHAKTLRFIWHPLPYTYTRRQSPQYTIHRGLEQPACVKKWRNMGEIEKTVVILGAKNESYTLNRIGDFFMFTRLIVSAVAVLVTAYTLEGVTVDPWWWAIIIAIVLGFINAFIRPLVKLLALPINIMTLGLFTFVINALMVLLCSWIVRPHFEIAGFWWALGFSLVLTLVNWALHLFVPEKKKKKR